MKDARKIKGLESQIKALQADADVIKERIKTDQREAHQKLKRIEELQVEIERLNHNGEIKVSEHAIIRYLERVRGLDIKALEAEIINGQIRDLVDKLGGSGEFPSGTGFSVKMKDYTITTII